MTKEQEIIEVYENAIKTYANPDSWIRCIVWNRFNKGKLERYGTELAEATLKKVQEIRDREDVK